MSKKARPGELRNTNRLRTAANRLVRQGQCSYRGVLVEGEFPTQAMAMKAIKARMWAVCTPGRPLERTG